jgi:hypothetical protein
MEGCEKQQHRRMRRNTVWKDVKNKSIEGREDQSMEGLIGQQYGRRERSEHGRMGKNAVCKHGQDQSMEL